MWPSCTTTFGCRILIQVKHWDGARIQDHKYMEVIWKSARNDKMQWGCDMKTNTHRQASPQTMRKSAGPSMWGATRLQGILLQHVSWKLQFPGIHFATVGFSNLFWLLLAVCSSAIWSWQPLTSLPRQDKHRNLTGSLSLGTPRECPRTIENWTAFWSELQISLHSNSSRETLWIWMLYCILFQVEFRTAICSILVSKIPHATQPYATARPPPILAWVGWVGYLRQRLGNLLPWNSYGIIPCIFHDCSCLLALMCFPAQNAPPCFIAACWFSNCSKFAEVIRICKNFRDSGAICKEHWTSNFLTQFNEIRSPVNFFPQYLQKSSTVSPISAESLWNRSQKPYPKLRFLNIDNLMKAIVFIRCSAHTASQRM